MEYVTIVKSEYKGMSFMGVMLIGLIMFLLFGFLTITTGGDEFVAKLCGIGFIIMIIGMPIAMMCVSG
jgi:hypothetical protein